MAKNDIMTTKELAEYIKLNEKTVIKMAQTGKLPGVKIGNQWRFHLAAIDNYIQGQIVKSADEDLDLLIQTETTIIPLSRLVSLENIKLNLKAKNGDDVLKILAKIARENKLTLNEQLLLKELRNREQMMSTAIGKGVAVPHPRNPSAEIFQKPNVVFARLEKGIDFGAPDAKDVFVFFMICAPNEFVHLRLLAKIAKLMHVENITEKLLRAQDREKIMQILLEVDHKRMFSD
ncbi:MAG: PTS sugar transporter subunit IIA [Candidatus Omnitrophica bacterium]|nr:PTS sugar transporter subunit IIA [Candidatus Omnitrophota bacterium]